VETRRTKSDMQHPSANN